MGGYRPTKFSAVLPSLSIAAVSWQMLRAGMPLARTVALSKRGRETRASPQSVRSPRALSAPGSAPSLPVLRRAGLDQARIFRYLHELPRKGQSKMFLSIDPGKWDCGAALWDSDGQLISASLVKNLISATCRAERVEIWRGMARGVRAWADCQDPDLILEIPQVDLRTRGAAKITPLFDLSGVQGAIACMWPNARILWSPTPSEWKGQLPKEISQARVDARLSAGERDLIAWPAKSLRHNVYDALHLGLVWLEREKIR